MIQVTAPAVRGGVECSEGAVGMETEPQKTHWNADEIRELICALEELRSGMLKLEASLA